MRIATRQLAAESAGTGAAFEDRDLRSRRTHGSGEEAHRSRAFLGALAWARKALGPPRGERRSG